MSNPVLNLSDVQKVKLTAAFTDIDGYPTGPISTPIWEASPAGDVTLTPNASDHSCEVASTNVLGTCTVTASSVDANGAAISAAVDIIISASAPVAIGLSYGVPEPK